MCWKNVFSNNSRYLAAVKFAIKVRSETETNVQSNLAKACIAAQHELINGTNEHPTLKVCGNRFFVPIPSHFNDFIPIPIPFPFPSKT